MLSPWWKKMTLRWAGMFYLSIGDVECRHARNRRAAQPSMAWSTFCNITTNQEACALLEASKPKTSPPPPKQIKSDIEDRGCLRRKRSLQLFRDDKMKGMKARGKKTNICTTAFWDACKNEFDELPLHVMADYELRSRNSGHAAAANRAARKAARQKQEPAKAVVARGHMARPIADASDDRHIRGCESLAAWAAAEGTDADAGQEPSNKPEYPLHASKFSSVCGHYGLFQKISFTQILAKHGQATRAFCGDSKSVPDVVDYHDNCFGHFDPQKTPAAILDMVSYITDWFGQQTKGIPQAKLSEYHWVFAVEVMYANDEHDDDDDPWPYSVVQFFALVGHTNPYGRHKAKHLFLALELVGGAMETGGFDGGILKVKRRPFLPRAEAPRKPFDQGIHGRLDSMDLKDMCASIFGPIIWCQNR